MSYRFNGPEACEDAPTVPIGRLRLVAGTRFAAFFNSASSRRSARSPGSDGTVYILLAAFYVLVLVFAFVGLFYGVRWFLRVNPGTGRPGLPGGAGRPTDLDPRP